MMQPLVETKVRCAPKACPTCGGIGCLERPRFFCGQLLTDKDLDLAQRYLIEKNKLHNRHLVGMGAVCGLAVTCHPNCKGVVRVEPGYAIDCCGNDIVVCEPRDFNVPQFIKDCLQKKDPLCEGLLRTATIDCKGVPCEFYLTLSYDEELARPVTALIRDNGCTVNRCEPSRTREMYRLGLIDKNAYTGGTSLTLKNRICKCIEPVLSDKGDPLHPPLDTILKLLQSALSQQDIQTLQKAFNYFLFFVGRLYTANPHNFRCDICAKISKVTLPSLNAPFDWPAIRSTFASLMGYVLQYIVDCICYATLVPCEECKPDDAVVLARLTVQDDTITRICNSVRRWQPSALHRQQDELQTINELWKLLLRDWFSNLSHYELSNSTLELLCCKEDIVDSVVQNQSHNDLSGLVVKLQGLLAFLKGSNFCGSGQIT